MGTAEIEIERRDRVTHGDYVAKLDSSDSTAKLSWTHRQGVRHAEHTFVPPEARGKGVAELVRPGANKGAALHAFMQIAPFAGSRPIFVGDDVTDEDGMRAAIEFAGFGIAVGERVSEAARYHLPNVEAVHDWLDI